MPYQPHRKLLWSYAFHIPNVGNDGKKYKIRYEFKLESPILNDFELEMNTPGYRVEPMITLWVVQGTHKVISKIPCVEFIHSPLWLGISEDSQRVCIKEINRMDITINEMRKKFRTDYSIYYNNSTVYKGDKDE